MPPPTHDPLDDLAPDTWVLCASARLADSLRLRHAELQAQGRRRHWHSLNCCTVEQWLEQLRQNWLLRARPPAALLQRRALPPLLAQGLWQRIIASHLGPQAQYLFDLAALARLAQQAHALHITWGVRADGAVLSAEQQQFQLWQADFLAWCAAHGWASVEQLDAASAAAVDARTLVPAERPARVLLAGFAQANPVQQTLCARLRALHIPVQPLPTRARAERIELRRYPDLQAECRAAALWARQRLDAHPQARLALVAPDLAALGERLYDTLDDELAPELLHPGRAHAPRPYNRALGGVLADQPLVGAALLLLQRLQPDDTPSLADWSALLRHPYLGAPEQAAARARCEVQLRRQRTANLSLDALLAWAERHAPPELRATLQQWQTLRAHACTTACLPSAWCASLVQGLEGAGWCAGRHLNSHEYQAQQSFLAVLHSLAELDALGQPLRFGQCLQHLRARCQEQVFQPETEAQPRLQVLGALEASGLALDAVWVLGLHAAAWPPPAHPNPLLPASAQRLANGPGASAALQSAFAQQVLERLLGAAPQVCLSWPGQDEAGPCAMSPLLRGLAALQECAAPAPAHWAQRAWEFSPAQIEFLDDTHAPPLPPQARVRGGSAALRAQAICPAWAFYAWRLHAAALEPASDGLDARQRGSLLHAALAELWRGLHDQARLLACTPQERAQHVDQAVQKALLGPAAAAAELGPRRRALEQSRMQQLLLLWLELEAQRPQGFDVLSTEQSQELELAGLRFSLQIDRVDRLADGRLLVLDYKSSASVDSSSWAQARLTEPQLPLYATCAALPEGEVAALAFAHVLPQAPAWSGLAADSSAQLGRSLVFDSPKGRLRYPEAVYPTWGALLQGWQQRLQALAQELGQGLAQVRVAEPELLRHCPVLPLLRLSERRNQWLARVAQAAP